MYAKKLDKSKKDGMQAYLLVVGQCAYDIPYELEYDTEYELAKKGYNVVKLVELIKKICYSYKSQDHPLAAITKYRITLYSTKQKEKKSISDYLLSLKNRLSMFEAVGGTLIDQGIREHISDKLFKKKYTLLDDAEMKECDIVGKERMLAMLFILDGDPKIFKKLTDEIHHDHLKGLGTYPITVAAAQRSMIIHSSAVVVKTKQRDSEVAFGQISINGKAGYGTRRGLFRIYKGEGHHSWECKNKEKTDKVTKKKDDDGKSSISDTSSIPTTVDSNVKKKTQVLASGTETGTNYVSNHDVFELMLCALGGEFTAGTSSVIKELENTF